MVRSLGLQLSKVQTINGEQCTHVRSKELALQRCRKRLQRSVTQRLLEPSEQAECEGQQPLARDQ